MPRSETIMAVYTVHEPPPRADEAAADPVRFKFVRDGFHFWAFVLGPLWMLRHRLWLVLVLYLVVSAVMYVGLWFAGTTSGTKFVIGLLVSLLIGLEAPTLRRWTLARRGWSTIGVVSAEDAETAERRFFDAWTGHVARPQWHPPEPAPWPPGGGFHAPISQQPPVIGLFPQPGTRR
jgi:hypothetical protein